MRFGSRDHSEFSPRLAMVDCKTVRIFAYSSTREQSNKRSGMRLKTESETGERRFARVRLLRHALPISLLILRKKPTVLQSTPWSLVENNEPTDRNVQVVQTLDSTIHYRTNHYLADKYYFERFEPKSHSIRGWRMIVPVSVSPVLKRTVNHRTTLTRTIKLHPVMVKY